MRRVKTVRVNNLKLAVSAADTANPRSIQPPALPDTTRY
jgi:hypothetical protein